MQCMLCHVSTYLPLTHSPAPVSSKGPENVQTLDALEKGFPSINYDQWCHPRSPAAKRTSALSGSVRRAEQLLLRFLE